MHAYVDDIIFGETTDSLCEEFTKLMGSEFKISMMGKLRFFLGLQIKQTSHGTIICKKKYIKVLLKKFHLNDAKFIDTSIGKS